MEERDDGVKHLHLSKESAIDLRDRYQIKKNKRVGNQLRLNLFPTLTATSLVSTWKSVIANAR